MTQYTQTNNLAATFPVACHTDNVAAGSIFVAIKGMKNNGVDYIVSALHKGAKTIVVEQNTNVSHVMLTAIREHNAVLVYVENSRQALAQLSAQALGYPAQKLKIIAITGTKGKTTTTFLLEHILREAGYKTALLSTVKNSIGSCDYATKLTTQQPDYLHVFFDQCYKEGVEWVVMEVAAQAFSLYRVEGIEFDAAIFTNFSKEHGEFYATMSDYFAAKAEVIHHLNNHAPLLLNSHDSEVAKLAARTKNALLFDDHHSYQCPALIGKFNKYNISAATKCAEALGAQPEKIQKALYSFVGVPGRLEKYRLTNGALGIVDYAHNPSSFQAVLSELRTLTDHLIVVFGCGGDRDASRRPLMGALAAQFADVVVLTSDNPRSENPETIVEDIKAGIAGSYLNKIVCEIDREKAICAAYKHSRASSIIAVLGKGPDEYQIIQNITYAFSDKNILESF